MIGEQRMASRPQERTTSQPAGRLGYLSAAPRVSTRADADTGGPRSHILGVINAFQSLGWEVDDFIAGNKVNPALLNACTAETISRSTLRALGADLVRLGLSRSNARRARGLLGDVDLVYERLAVMQSLGSAFQRKGIPWVLETQGPFFYEAKADRKSIALVRLARRIELNAYRQCDALVCVSEPLKRIVIREAGVSAEKIAVIPNGVDVDYFDPARVATRRLSDQFVVGFVGRLLAWQALDVALEAIAELRAEGMDIVLAVVGDGPMRTAWEALSRKSSSAIFVGQLARDKVPSYIAGFDVGYAGHAPSALGEMYHSPLKLYEYMAMAKPVVSATSDDARSVVNEGVTGFTFESGNRRAVKAALSRAYLAKEKLADYGSIARRVIQEKHTWVARVQDILAHVNNVLESRPLLDGRHESPA